jgi:hypothetical protein
MKLEDDKTVGHHGLEKKINIDLFELIFVVVNSAVHTNRYNYKKNYVNFNKIILNYKKEFVKLINKI